MTIVESNGKFSLAHVTAVHTQLPVGVYLLKYNQIEGFHLAVKKDFELPKKLYGDYSIVDRWLASYEHNSEKNMGIILSGIKGSGKTITAQMFCQRANKPVIIVSDPFSGTEFVDFLTQFKDTIIFIDEFEKVYDYNTNSTDLLQLMDGNYPTKLIFLLTVNEFRINNYLINRLNRVKYRKHYDSLPYSIIEEVIDDLLINKEHRESVHKFFKRVNMCSFDLLVNIIKEMNLFNQDALECGIHLNLQSEKKEYQIYEEIDGTLTHQSSINIGGDEDVIYFSRSRISKAAEEAQNKNQGEDDPWDCIVNFKECNLKHNSDESLSVVAKDESYKFIFKEVGYKSLCI